MRNPISFTREPGRARTGAASLALACLALFAQDAAIAAEPPACIAPHDMKTLIRIALPDAIEGLADRCRPALPAGAFLPSEGMALAARYRQEAPVDPARARAAIEAATGQDLSSVASDDTVQLMARQLIGQQIAQKLPLGDCREADTLVHLAAPLHPGDMAEAIVLVLKMAPDTRIKGLAICHSRDE
jgi:hypothetical protein